MNFLNKAQIIGNLTRDPEVRETKNGQAVCTLGVATNRRWKDNNGEYREEAEFHNVVCWGKLAELAQQLLKKGTKVFFEGRLQTRNWEDETGIKHYRTEIVAQDMIVLSGRKSINNIEVSEELMAEVEKKAPTESVDILSEDLDI
jgi:single-strand DNA-binding protein